MAIKKVFETAHREKRSVEMWKGEVYVEIGIAEDGGQLGPYVEVYETETATKPSFAMYWTQEKTFDPITSWRATEILNLIPYLELTDLQAAYYAAKRKLHGFDLPLAQPAIDKLGVEEHEEIMDLEIPDEIYELVLELSRNGKLIENSTLDEEYRAGTLSWGPDYDSDKPDTNFLLFKLEKQILFDLHRHLRSLEEHWDLDSDDMAVIASSLVLAARKGIFTNYGYDIALGVAAVTYFEGHKEIPNLEDILEVDEISRYKRTMRSILVEQITTWLRSVFQTGLYPNRQPLRQEKEYIKLLTELVPKFDKLPLKDDWITLE